jgi:hypothetical protein
MDTKILVVGIVVALFIGAGAGYTLAPESVSSPELESQIEEYQSNIITLENEKSNLQTSLSNTMSTNTELQASVTSLESKKTELQIAVTNLESENTELREILRNTTELIESVEEKLDMFESGFGSPVFDSGWIAIAPGETKSMEHGLGTEENLFVYVIGRFHEGQTNQLYYGLGYIADVEIGNGWTMDDTLISVTRGVADVHWIETRVYIWRIYRSAVISEDKPTSYNAMGTIDSYVDAWSAEVIHGDWSVKIIDDELVYRVTYSELNLNEVEELSPVGSVDIFTHTLTTDNFEIKYHPSSPNHVLTFSGEIQYQKVMVKTDWTREIISRTYNVTITITPDTFFSHRPSLSGLDQDWDLVGTTIVIQP